MLSEPAICPLIDASTHTRLRTFGHDVAVHRADPHSALQPGIGPTDLRNVVLIAHIGPVTITCSLVVAHVSSGVVVTGSMAPATRSAMKALRNGGGAGRGSIRLFPG
jgi:hypothetical protein